MNIGIKSNMLYYIFIGVSKNIMHDSDRETLVTIGCPVRQWLRSVVLVALTSCGVSPEGWFLFLLSQTLNEGCSFTDIAAYRHNYSLHICLWHSPHAPAQCPLSTLEISVVFRTQRIRNIGVCEQRCVLVNKLHFGSAEIKYLYYMEVQGSPLVLWLDYSNYVKPVTECQNSKNFLTC